MIVEITDYPASINNPVGRVIELLGASSDEPGMDIQIVIRKHHLPHRFPPEVVEQAEAIPVRSGRASWRAAAISARCRS